MKQPEGTKRITKKILVFILLIVIACMLFPPPVYIMAPGETKSIQDMVISKQKIEEHALFYTTVLLKPTNWGGAMQSLFNRDEALLLKTQVLQGKSLEEYKASTQLSMYESFNTALETAYTYLGIPYIKRETGLYVSESSKSSSFFVGDKLMSIVTDNHAYHIDGLEGLLTYINQWSVIDKELQLIVKNGQTTREVSLESLEDVQQPIDEEQLAEWMKVKQFYVQQEIVVDDDTKRFSINTERVGGASAGLVLTLSIIDTLKSDEIETNKNIAATGTIAVDGKIGIIGGIEQKVVSVSEAGMDVFFVPLEQLKIAQKKS